MSSDLRLLMSQWAGYKRPTSYDTGASFNADSLHNHITYACVCFLCDGSENSNHPLDFVVSQRPDLVAPHCAIVSAIPPILRAMGSFVSPHSQLGATPPPPFLSVCPLESRRSGGAIPPHKRANTCARSSENKAKRMRYPLCDSLSRKGIAR